MTHFDYESVDWQDVFARIEEGQRGTLSKIAQELKIDKSRLSKLHHKHLHDPNFDPRTLRWGGHNYMDLSSNYAISQAIQGITKHESAEKERVRQKLTGFDQKTSPACAYITKQFGAEVRQHCLVEIAKYLAKKRGLPLDRDSKRRKSVLMKWFHDNWAILSKDMPMFQVINEEVIVDDPEAMMHRQLELQEQQNTGM